MITHTQCQCSWHWVWVLHMGTSYTVMVLQREMWKGIFKHWSTTIVRFMTASIIPLQMNLVAHIWIHIPLPLMIDHTRIKEPAIPHICSQIPSLLPLKIILLLWLPLLIIHIYFLLMILILSMSWRNICLYLVGLKEGTAVGNMIKKYATKKQGYIAPHALIRARNFMIVMVFPGLIQRQVFYSWNINIIYHNFSFDSCVFLPPIF